MGQKKKKKKLVPRNPLVAEAKFKKAGLMEPTKKEKNKKERKLSKKSVWDVDPFWLGD